MNNAQKLIAGLSLVAESVGAGSFDSGSATFRVDRSLSDEEQEKLEALGFEVGISRQYAGHMIRFNSWSDD